MRRGSRRRWRAMGDPRWRGDRRNGVRHEPSYEKGPCHEAHQDQRKTDLEEMDGTLRFRRARGMEGLVQLRHGQRCRQ
ncbi:MAG: hypothetical protein VX948_06860 [Candidatus Latescibacterota bacterium]|nr:hypothetical protein [Candidatus Latescibacterota bacterium]